MTIGDPVVMHPGVHLLHGQVVIDGVTEIHPGVVIGPFVSIGLVKGDIGGPTIEEDVRVGTGAKRPRQAHAWEPAPRSAQTPPCSATSRPGATVRRGRPARPTAD